MDEIHSCSYYCDRPECIKAQRDELRDRLTIIKNYPEKDNLAQPEREPVAYAVYHRIGGGKSLHWPEQHSPDGDANAYQLAPLYTTPLQRKPLTGYELADLWYKQSLDWLEFARAIETAHGIKEES